MPLRSHKELDVWNGAMRLVELVYQLTAKLPRAEMFGLSSQLRRAAVSVPANIAEGYGRTHRGEYLHHLSIAMGSLQEFDTLLEIISRLGLAPEPYLEPAKEVATSVGKMLTRLMQSLQPPLSSRPQPRAPRP